ncbi:hypothetical protein C8Q76DRAFT_620615 [Earliella scabrosa]|nr:hypothetical protein C8Q76DRAFT_620615 [Earliella scabrosa]
MDEEERDAVLPAPPVELGKWSEGTERYSTVPEDQIDRFLGIDDLGGFIPGFNRKEDPNGLTDPWTPEGRAELEKDTAVTLNLRWHQKVGVLRMQEQLYAGKPLLLMDEVGVGKTAQAVAVIAKYAYDRAYFARCSSFPGMFGEWQSLPLSDATEYFSPCAKTERPRCVHKTEKGITKHTLFSAGREYGIFVLDEAHLLRTLNKFNLGATEVRFRSVFTTAMTATPVMTTPQVS